jgi:hypothetical protein
METRFKATESLLTLWIAMVPILFHHFCGSCQVPTENLAILPSSRLAGSLPVAGTFCSRNISVYRPTALANPVT